MSQFRKNLDAASSKGFTTASQRSKSKSRYEAVEPKTNTGYHVGKMMEDFDIIQRNFKFKPDEIFPRTKIGLLVALICESAFLEPEQNNEKADEDPNSAQSTLSSYRSSDQSPTCFVGPMKPYLLLDVRDTDDYLKGHIITAENYPKTKLARGNYETQSLLKYRNHPEYIIIIYDEDEIIAPQVITTLIQRGYNNVYMLSGGLKVAKHCFPHSLVVSDQSIVMSVEISQILAAQLQQMSFRYQK